jgi:hypothetical protein
MVLNLLDGDVGPSRMQPIISLRDFGGLRAKMITPSFSPLQGARWKRGVEEKEDTTT